MVFLLLLPNAVTICVKLPVSSRDTGNKRAYAICVLEIRFAGEGLCPAPAKESVSFSYAALRASVTYLSKRRETDFSSSVMPALRRSSRTDFRGSFPSMRDLTSASAYCVAVSDSAAMIFAAAHSPRRRRLREVGLQVWEKLISHLCENSAHFG